MRTYSKQSGFSLIEIMVGMTVGLIVILVILQTMSLFENQRQRSSGASNMQSSGLLALYSLEQETRQAGYGMVVNYLGQGDLPCLRINGYGGTPGVFLGIPISISTSGVQDSITLARIDTALGGLITGGAAANISSPIAAQADLVSASGIVLDSISGVFKVSGVQQTVATYPASATGTNNMTYRTITVPADTVLISAKSSVNPKPACALLTVNQPLAASAVVLNASGVITPADASGVVGSPAWSKLSFSYTNNVGLDNTIAPTFASFPVGTAVMHNLGPSPTLVRATFSVNNLAQFVKTMNGASSVVADNVVSLQAQYGVAPAGSQTINCWVNPTAANTNPAGAACPAGEASDWTQAGLLATPANIRRIKAIRVAIVARNSNMEKATNGVCTTTTTAPTSWLNGPVIDLTADANWRCYRYKVYQTIIPLNNVILGNL